MSDYNRGGRQRPQGASRPAGRAQSPASRYPTARPRPGAAPQGQAPRRGAAQQNGPRSVSAGPRSEGSGSALLPRGFLPLVGVCIGILVLGLVLQGLMPNGFALIKDEKNSPRTTQMVTEIHSHGPLRINEIMSSNGGVLTDKNGEAPDWVEVTNVSNGAINLSGYVLARNSKSGNVFIFPDHSLEAGESVIVFADSRIMEEGEKELHAPFRLSADGDVMMLFNQADVAIDTVNIPALAENTVYARTGADTWEISEMPTPGRMNTEEDYIAMTTVSGDSPVKIVEVVSSSSSYGPDENGVCHDYVILRNTSGEGVDLSGWYLSDTQQLARMWRIPDGVSLSSGATLLIHCSGLNRTELTDHLHTNFKLSSEGEQVMLSNADGQPVDLVNFDLLKSDTAYVRGADGSWSIGTPTAAKSGEQ